MSKISELSDGGSLQSTDYLIAVRSGGNVKVQADGNLSLGTVTTSGLTVSATTAVVDVLAATNDDATLFLRESGIGVVGAELTYDGGDNQLYLKVGNNSNTKRLSIARDSGDISFYEDTGTTPKFFWDASAESLGIGTTSPLSKLSVQGDGLTVRLDGTANTSRGIFLRNTGTGEGIFQTDGNMHFLQEDASKYMRFSTANAEAMRIDSSGNLLVGRASVGTSGTGHSIRGGDSAVFAREGGEVLIIARNTNNGQAVRFDCQGTNGVGSIDVTTTATTYNTSSDYRLKDVDGPITNSGAYIDALKPVQGSWKADGSRFIGLIAHEVQEVSETQIATGEKDGEEMQGMDYSAPELIANLIAEIQSLRARVAQLEGA